MLQIANNTFNVREKKKELILLSEFFLVFGNDIWIYNQTELNWIKLKADHEKYSKIKQFGTNNFGGFCSLHNCSIQ